MHKNCIDIQIMNHRTTRQLAIKKILTTREIHSQEGLLTILLKEGFEITQATLSRDLKTLKVAKIPDGNSGYRYSVSEHIPIDHDKEKEKVNFLVDGFESIKFSGNLAVIKTRPGYASSIASVLDNADPYEIIGTIAGDDTILIIMKENVSNNDLKNRLILIMPKLRDKLMH